MHILRHSFTSLSIACMTLTASYGNDVEQLFTINCSACHQLNEMIVGPSLVEISKIYKDDIEGFVQWCITPKQKRKNVAQMPSMAHVGEDNLKAIHKHILSVSDGVVEKKKEWIDPHKDHYFQREAPYIQRVFLPNAGPASIAVRLTEEINVCWDATYNHLAYIWEGNKLDPWPHWSGNGNRRPNLGGEVIYTESKRIQNTDASDQKSQFLGYRLVNNYPEFSYSLGKMQIKELLTSSDSSSSFQRQFTITGVKGSLSLELGEQANIQITTSQGTIENNVLTVKGNDSLTFTLTYTLLAK